MTTLLGIILGLTTACSLCFAYVYSRLFVIRHQNASWQLLLVSHVYMGVASVLALPLIWPDDLPLMRQYILPLFGTAGFYVAAQGGLFILMRMTNPSRVVPLLGTKILILAALAAPVFGRTVTPMQWLAVGACFGAVLVLNFSGGSLPPKALLLLLLTCTGYALSDLNIDRLVRALAPLSTLHAAAWGVLASYILLGIAASTIMLATRSRTLFVDWQLSLPFAALWLFGMLTLFICIGLVGPLFAIILQSTRGLMSVVLGAILAHRGWLTVEPHVTRRIFLQRMAAAALMVAAVALYALS